MESRGKLQCSVIAAHTDRRVAVRNQWGVCDATLKDCLSDSLISINLSVCCHTSTGALSLFFFCHILLSRLSYCCYLLPTISIASRFSFSSLWPFFCVYFFSAYQIISLSYRKTADVYFLSFERRSPNKQLSLGIWWVLIPLSRLSVRLPLNFTEIKYWFAWYKQFCFCLSSVLCLTDIHALCWIWISLRRKI